MNRQTIFITGASSGFGAACARLFAAGGMRLVLAARRIEPLLSLKEELDGTTEVHIIPLDVRDREAVQGAVAGLPERFSVIDVLLNNAGLLTGMAQQTLEHLDATVFEQEMAVNAMGPMRVTRAFLPNVLVSRQKIIVALSSAASSHGMIRMPSPLYAYRASKAALNMLMHIMATDLAGRGVRVALLNPGLVDTRGIMALKPGDPVPEEFRNAMPAIRSGQLVLITPEESVRGMLQRIGELTPEQSGIFMSYDGKVMPW